MTVIARIAAALLGLAVVLVLLAGAGIALIFPRVSPPSDLVIEGTPEQIERGRYLAENVMACMGCHSVRMLDRYSAPLVEGRKGGGGFVFDEGLGIPGVVTSRNITPAGLADWTDGEIVRAITAGVSRDGEALFPLMPYLGYGQLDPEDIHAVVAYLRTMPPVATDAPQKDLDFRLVC